MQRWNTDWALGDAADTVRRAVGTARAQVGQGVGRVRAVVEQQVAASASSSGRPPFTWTPEGTDGAAAGRPPPPFEVRVCSWNLHGNQLDPGDNVSHWIAPPGGCPDVLVVGVQELVDLGPRSVVMSASGDDLRQAALEARVEQALAPHGDFTKVSSFGMVGLAMLIYVRGWLMPFLSEVDCDRVKTGLDGMGGNKGCVATRLMVGDVSLCFVNVHLASGQNAVAERNQHLAQVLADAFQGVSSRGYARPPKHCYLRQSRYAAAFHHLVVVFGDFNSRLDVPKEETNPPGTPEDWLKRDQLLRGQMAAVRGFCEGDIGFPPTYKYIPGTGHLSSTRCPAWCDRIMFKADYGTEVVLREYDAYLELLRSSDHLPVVGHLRVAGPAVAAAEAEAEDSGALEELHPLGNHLEGVGAAGFVEELPAPPLPPPRSPPSPDARPGDGPDWSRLSTPGVAAPTLDADAAAGPTAAEDAWPSKGSGSGPSGSWPPAPSMPSWPADAGVAAATGGRGLGDSANSSWPPPSAPSPWLSGSGGPAWPAAGLPPPGAACPREVRRAAAPRPSPT